MTVYRLRLGGRLIFSWEVEGEQVDPTELLADALASLVADNTTDDTEETTPNHTQNHTGNNTPNHAAIGGASGHNFERDVDPRYPEADKDYDTWIPRPFGFR